MRISDSSTEISPIASSFLNKTLGVYQSKGTVYLRRAEIVQLASMDGFSGEQQDAPIATTRGQFRIPESCYIKSTGHFNAVEYIICYNQLAYVVFGHLIAEGILMSLPSSRVSDVCRNALKQLSIQLFFAKQLSSMLILKTETKFRKELNPLNFFGELSIDSIFYKGQTLFTKTTCKFMDSEGDGAEGKVMLACPLHLHE